MNFKKEEPVNLSLVKEFVYEAKIKAFAGSGNKITMNNQNSIYSFRGYGDEKYDGNPLFAGMIYTDEYSGNTVEAGTETVSINLGNVWRNQYFGGSYVSWWADADKLGIKTTKKITYLPFVTTAFLKQALMQLSVDFPVRGPRYHNSDVVIYNEICYFANWEYENQWKGIPVYEIDDPFAAFQGEEIIRCNGKTIYWHGYQGGFLRNKYYPIVLK